MGMRDYIYYTEFTSAENIPYRLEMIPADCNDSGEPVALSSEDYREFPPDLIQTDLIPTAEFSERGRLPVGIAQKNDLQIKCTIDKTNTDHSGFLNLIGKPLVYRTQSIVDVFGITEPLMQTFVEFGDVGTCIWDLPGWETRDNGVLISGWASYTIESTSPDAVITHSDYTSASFEISPGVTRVVTGRRFYMDISSPEAAFVITLHDGSYSASHAVVYGNPVGYIPLRMPLSYRYGNVWRLWSMDGTDKDVLLFEGMQRRVPPTAIDETSQSADISISAGDTMRVALEPLTMQDIVDNIGTAVRTVSNRIGVTAIQTADSEVTYFQPPGNRYYKYHSVEQLYNAFSAAGNILSDIRRITSTFTVEPPRHLITYDFFESAGDALQPDGGIEFADLLFISGIYDNDEPRGGVLSPLDSGDEQSWFKMYGNCFDLLTDLAGNTLSKHVVIYTATSITVKTYAMLAHISTQPSSVSITESMWCDEKRKTTPGKASVRGTNADIQQPHQDDVKQAHNYAAYSEREDELSPKILLHNIPTYNLERIPQMLMIAGDSIVLSGITYQTVKPPIEHFRINAGNSVTFNVPPRTNWQVITGMNRDQIISEVQATAGLANNIARALTLLYGTNALITVEGDLLTSAAVNQSQLGAIHQVSHAFGNSMMILVHCSDNIQSGISNVEYVGLL